MPPSVAIPRRSLAEELGVEPAEQTTALYESIRDGLLGEGPEEREDEDDLPRARFVARERELAQLGGFLTTALAGEGRVVFVTGEAGSGKTALMEEFARRAMAAHRDLVVASGSCNAYTGIGDPYLPFREIMHMLTADIEARPAGGAITPRHTRRLWAAFPDAVRALVEEGPDLIDVFLPGMALALRAKARMPEGAIWQERVEAVVKRTTLRQALDSAPEGDPDEAADAAIIQQTTSSSRSL